MLSIDFSKYYQPKPKQVEAHKNRSKYLLYGGGMGSGKSWWLCAEAIRNAMQFSGNRLVIVRKELSVIKRTIMVTFFSICPPQIIKSFNKSTSTIEFVNGSSLTFMEANSSKDPLLNKIKGLEIGWFGIDEANEVNVEVYNILKSRLRWVLHNGCKPRYEGRLTSNPENCWLIPKFIHSTSTDEVYIKAITTDNFDEEDEYVKTLREAFKDSPNLLKKYLEGDWSVVDSINQLIASKYIDLCRENVGSYGTSLGVDIARYGDDRTVFALIVEGNIQLIETYLQTSITEVASRTMELIQEWGINSDQVGIDGVGLGAGVIDILKSNGYEIQDLQGGAKPIETSIEEAFKPFNLRTQMYYQLMRDIKGKELGGIIDDILVQELKSIQYEIITDKTVKIVSKEIIKKTNGSSPDISDALCYANWVRENRNGDIGFVMFA